MQKSKARWIFDIMVFVIGMIFNLITWILIKWQDKVKISGKYFSHPFMQNGFGYFSATFCQPTFLCLSILNKIFNKENNQPYLVIKPVDSRNKMKFPYYWLLLCGTFDFVASNLIIVCMIWLDFTDFSLITSIQPVSMYFWAILILKRKFVLVKTLSIFLVFAGLALSGLQTILYGNVDWSSYLILMGFLLTIFAQIIWGLSCTIEEWIFNHYDVHPLEMAGIEAIWALFLALIGICIFHFVPVSNAANPAGFTFYEGNLYLERFDIFFETIGNNLILMVSIIVIFYVVILQYWTYLIVTKLYSSLTSNIFYTYTLTVLGWIVSLVMPNPSEEGAWETFHWLKFCGLIVVSVGAFLYFELHLLFFDEPTSPPPKKIEYDDEEKKKIII